MLREPPRPDNEAERLKTLHDLHLLDTPIEQRFERITRMAQQMLNVPISAFTLLDTSRQWFKSIRGLDATETERNLSFCAYAILEDSTMLVPDAKKDARFHDHPLVNGDPNISFYAGRPVRAPNGMKIGVLCAVDQKPRDMSDDEKQVLDDLGAMLENELRAAELSRAHNQLMHELDSAQRLALIDPLTRLWNRGGIEEILKREWAKTTRNGEPLCVVMADLDHFKAVNDTLGHPIGDVVLKTAARRLLSALRTEDAVGRFGGEEFLIVLNGCQPGMLESTLERIRATVSVEPVETEAGPVPITMSLGAATMSKEFPISSEALVKRADQALYAAKNAGRNCYQIAA